MTYNVNVSRQVFRDIEQAILFKKYISTYERTIQSFIINLDTLIYEILTDNPKQGPCLSYRLIIKTPIRYSIHDEYLLFYDINDHLMQVNVLRLLPAKSDGMNTFLHYHDRNITD